MTKYMQSRCLGWKQVQVEGELDGHSSFGLFMCNDFLLSHGVDLARHLQLFT